MSWRDAVTDSPGTLSPADRAESKVGQPASKIAQRCATIAFNSLGTLSPLTLTTVTAHVGHGHQPTAQKASLAKVAELDRAGTRAT